jgi:dipeptidyl aminopeptidase/acylaminoacyl peptidase
MDAQRLMLWAIIGGLIVSVFVVLGLVVVGSWLFRSGGASDRELAQAPSVAAEKDTTLRPSATPEPSLSGPAQPGPGTTDPARAAREPLQAASAKLHEEFLAQRKNPEGHLHFRWETTPEGQRVVWVAPVVDEVVVNEKAHKYVLLDGQGFPLISRNESWTRLVRWNPAPPAEDQRKLVQHRVDGDFYRLTRLSSFGTPRELLADRRLGRANPTPRGQQRAPYGYTHKHLWSPDGKYLYVLSGIETRSSLDPTRNNHLLKVNAESWEVELQVDLSPEADNLVSDIAWSSQGLVAALNTDRGVAPRPPKDPNQRHWMDFGRSWLVLLDPVTLAMRQVWLVRGVHAMAGRSTSEVVYLGDHASFVLVNMRTGELIDILTRRRVTGAAPADFTHPEITPDGKWLLTNSDETGSLNRLGIVGTTLSLQQRRLAGTTRVKLTADGQFVAFATKDTATGVRIDDLNQTLGTVRWLDGTAVALDPVKKTIYLCAVDRKEQLLKLRLLQDELDLELALDRTVMPEAPTENRTRPAFLRDAERGPPAGHEFEPADLSTDPLGRGVIVFVERAAYWVEPKGTSRDWAFGGGNPVVVDATETLAPPPPSAEELRRQPPPLVAKPLPAKAATCDAPGTTIELAVGIRQLVLDRDTGDVALLTHKGDLYICRAAFFDGDLTAVAGPLQVEREAACCFKTLGKRRLLLVPKQGMIWALDPQTLQKVEAGAEFQNPVEVTDLARAEITSLTSPPWPDDPTVAVVFRSATSTSHGIQQSLVSGRRTPSLFPGFVPFRPVPYRDPEGPQAAVQRSAAVSEEEFVRAFGTPLRQHVGSLIVDPYGQFVTLAQGPPADVRGKQPAAKSTRPGPPMTTLCVMERRPWVIARHLRELLWYRRDDFSEGHALPMPKRLQVPDPNEPASGGGNQGPLRRKRTVTYSSYPPTVAVDDPAHDRLIVAGNPLPVPGTPNPSVGVIWVLPAAAQAPDEPLLAVRLPLPVAIPSATPLSLPVETPDARVQVSLVEGPKRAQLNQRQFTWTPGRDELGPQKVVLRVTAGGQSKDFEYPCVVRE